ncbi:MAG: hypothetical protein KDA42_04855 [Planctomycetales bacterium]|nr:hypothetical protein [Planctomycetales bacterium]
MTQATLDIDRIVQEVVRRLREVPAPVAEPLLYTTSHAATNTKSNASPDGVEIIEDRVVTVESLRGRLNGKRQLLVRPGAIVTPAVRDLLKDAHIVLHIQAPDEATPCDATDRVADVAIACCDEKRYGDWARKLIPRNRTLQAVRANSLSSNVRALAKAVDGRRMLGILISEDTFPALCLANRQRGVRAVAACSIERVEKAVATAGVNVLIVNPSETGIWRAKPIVAAFCRIVERRCPPVLLETP